MALNLPHISPTRKRRPLLDQFPDAEQSSSSPRSRPAGLRDLGSCLKGSFSRGWPLALSSSRGRVLPAATTSSGPAPFTLRMGEDYRIYDDRWRSDRTVTDEPADVSGSFNVTQTNMSEISEMLKSHQASQDDMKAFMLQEMAKSVFGSNNLARKGLGHDETYKICLAIFQGEEGLEYVDRSIEYQARLSSYALKGTKPGEKAVLRSRREVVQHAAAFQHMINAFVKQDVPMSERLIKETHGILVEGLGAEDAGVFNLQNFGGTYRHGSQEAYAGTHEYTRPADVPKAMKSLIENLEADLQQAEKTKIIDPFMLAAKYCDRFVNIHPFKDANGRMCRLILNAILIKYAGIVVSLGEKGAHREEYLRVAQESTSVGGHGGQLGNMVLESAVGTLRRLKAALSRQSRT